MYDFLDELYPEITLETDDMEWIAGSYGACSEHIDSIPLLRSIVIKTFYDGQSKIPVHVSDKRADLHIK